MKEREREKVNVVYTAILHKIVLEREKAGFTQYDMACLLGLTESGYFKVEKGNTRLDLERLLIILNHLNISLKDFFKDLE